jgi:chemotaxis response regulator CheB
VAGNFRIVSLCGSAGALSAYVDILHAAPENTGMVFIVLSHRRPRRVSYLHQILSRATRMHVEEIIDGTILQPNCVYIAPAGSDLTTDGRIFHLVPTTKVLGWPDAFDIFLLSLAHCTRNRAITVILSGMARDGSAALSELRKSGGINFAQSDAQYPSMPDSAFETGKIDSVGSSMELAIILSHLCPAELQAPTV